MKTQMIAAVMTAVLASAVQGQGILDQQLGPTAPPAARLEPDKPIKHSGDAAKTGTSTPGEQRATPAAPNNNDIVSPDAVKRVDDADLINKLTKPDDGKAAANEAVEKMKDMLDRMGQSETRLTQKDPGDVTQETQRRIMTDLDVLIEFARKQQQQGSGQGPPQPGPPGEGKSYSQGNQNGKNQGGTTAASGSFLPGNNQQTPQQGDDNRSKGPAEWGTLRPRERELISHGANEEYLTSYKDMIERYYQALAELGKKK